MDRIVLQPTSLAQWYSLVNETQAKIGCQLTETHEGYLVFLLMRYTRRPELLNQVVALDFIHQLSFPSDDGEWQAIGDRCLLISGLFPQVAKRRHVTVEYYVKLGRGAYEQLADSNSLFDDDLFAGLCESFDEMRRVLYQMNNQHQVPPTM